MSKYKNYLICTDYDGTFSERGEVSEINASAVKRFQDEGGFFTIASGRSPDFLLSKTSFKPNAPLVSLNGTMINDQDDMHVLAEYPLPSVSAKAIFDITANTETEMVIIYGKDREGSRWDKESQTLEQFVASVPEPWYKILFVQDPAKTPGVIAKAKEMYGDTYEFDESWPAGIELHEKGTGKGVCLDYFRKWSNNPDLIIIGVGDYNNDETLVRMADIGYAVANATDVVKAAADRITVSNTENAIARIIEDIENDII